MATWVLIPCLKALFTEFNQLAPDRDRTSDGSIGDQSHAASSSDHNPDETGNTPTEDADSVNEVHAIDVDDDLRKAGWDMTRCVEIIRQRHQDGRDDRLQNIIWNRQITSRSWGWTWRPYTGASPHTEHAHFSARYTAGQEADTRPWGLLEDDMPSADEIAAAVERRIFGHKIVDRADTAKPQRELTFQTWMEYTDSRRNSILAAVAALQAKDPIDEQALAAALAPALVAALPADQPVTGEQLQAAILGALRELAAGPAA